MNNELQNDSEIDNDPDTNRVQQVVQIPRYPSANFTDAVRMMKYQMMFMLVLHIIIYITLVVGQIITFVKNCENNSSIQKWSIIFTSINLLHLYHYTYYLYLLNQPKELLIIAEEIQQLENVQQLPRQWDHLQATVEQIQGLIRQSLIQQHRSLKISLTLTIILAQASILSFCLIIQLDYYKIQTVPMPYFSGNCQDVLLNIGLIVFWFQLGAYIAFYMSLVLIIAFSPLITIYGIWYLCRFLLMRYRRKRAAIKFPIKYLNQIQGAKECAICMQDYLVTDKLKELTCMGKHHFHKTCIDQWLSVQSVCPLCRTDFHEQI